MEHSLHTDKISLGVCYYPEHWDRSLWADDLRRMKQYGLRTIRIAEFSWNLMEPTEGNYDFSFWDEFLALAAEEGMQVIFCTPTATPPAWLTEKYPEVLNADGDGNKMYHGLRRHYNLTSTTYHRLCDELVHRLGERYADHPAIVGWQIDNEVNCEADHYYAESDHEAFRAYLKERFGTLESLNDKLGTAFWSQTYTDWGQLHLARRTPSGLNYANPHLMLEEARFVSHSAVAFIARQARLLRETGVHGFITTNGIFNRLDYQALMESGLDFIMYDSYPNFAYEVKHPHYTGGELKDRNSSFNLARVRAISPVFGIMEQQSGPGGWTFRMSQVSPKPGQMRLWTMQSIAHGADYVSYFRWRTCSFGTEIYWHGLNDYANVSNRRLRELTRISEDVEKLAEVTGSPYLAEVGILTDYDNEWDGQADAWHGPLEAYSRNGWFTALQKAHVPFDFVDFRDETPLEQLKKYRLLIYAHATILTEERAALLKAYVEAGGRLVMGCRSGYKDIYGRCPMQRMPGAAADIVGATVGDFTFLGPDDAPETVIWNDEEIPAPLFNDVLDAAEGEVIAAFHGNYYDGAPALVRNKIGAGEAWYFGACFAEETAAKFLKELRIGSPTASWLTLPAEVELALRGAYVFLLNYTQEEKPILLMREAKELLTGETLTGSRTIPPYGVMVLKKE